MHLTRLVPQAATQPLKAVAVATGTEIAAAAMAKVGAVDADVCV
jgi:hypothetical protein